MEGVATRWQALQQVPGLQRVQAHSAAGQAGTEGKGCESGGVGD
jgi:hypothetical protein